MPRIVLYFLLLLVCLAAGCAAPPKPPLTGLVPGRELATLSSAVSLSVRSGDRSVGGRGVLVFQWPDRFHLALLSPFGSTLADIYSDGKRFTCIIPSRQTAYAGFSEELPERDGLQAWALMRWVVERTPPRGEAQEMINVNGAGVRERLYYDERGLLERKETEQGDSVVYRDYGSVNGVAFPHTIELTDSRDNMVRIAFDEPEINRPVEEKSLTPYLGGLRLLPFSEFKGF